MATDCMIWLGMFGSGVLIGMAQTITANHRLEAQREQLVVAGECCVVVLGATMPTYYACLTASIAVRMLGTSSTDSAVCQDWIRRHKDQMR